MIEELIDSQVCERLFHDRFRGARSDSHWQFALVFPRDRHDRFNRLNVGHLFQVALLFFLGRLRHVDGDALFCAQHLNDVGRRYTAQFIETIFWEIDAVLVHGVAPSQKVDRHRVGQCAVTIKNQCFRFDGRLPLDLSWFVGSRLETICRRSYSCRTSRSSYVVAASQVPFSDRKCRCLMLTRNSRNGWYAATVAQFFREHRRETQGRFYNNKPTASTPIVTKKLPEYIKLFSGDQTPVVAPQSKVPKIVEGLSSAFESATGWQLTPDESKSGETADPSDRPFAVAEAATDVRVARELADTLADQIGDLLGELTRTQRALWRSEGELAAAVPLVSRPEEEQHLLAERLEAVLQGGAESLNCQAAGLYVLDDDTRHLKLRSSWGLPEERLTCEPRRLRGSKADLEALTGHAVVLESAARFDIWSAPEEYGSAICIPVSTATVPLGTLWFFGVDEQEFTDAQVNLAEIVAGRLACELEREILLRERVEFGPQLEDEVAVVSNWQKDASQNRPSVEGWEIAALAGQADSSDAISVESLTGYAFEDGRLSLTMGLAHEKGVEGALTAASLSGAAQLVRSIVEPARRLNRINDAISALSSGDKASSLLCATMGPHDSELQLSTAGETHAFVIRPHGWELVSNLSPAVGVTADAIYDQVSVNLEAGDLLLTVSAAPPRASRRQSDRYVDANDLAELVLRHHHLSPPQLAELAHTILDSKPHIWSNRPSLLILRREAT